MITINHIEKSIKSRIKSYDKEIAVSPLSSKFANLFKENSRILISKKLHNTRVLKTSNYRNVANQEIAISLDSENINISF